MFMEYVLKNGGVITEKVLDDMENSGLSEGDIAKYFNCSRMTIYRVRCKMGWKHKFRSDKIIGGVIGEKT